MPVGGSGILASIGVMSQPCHKYVMPVKFAGAIIVASLLQSSRGANDTTQFEVGITNMNNQTDVLHRDIENDDPAAASMYRLEAAGHQRMLEEAGLLPPASRDNLQSHIAPALHQSLPQGPFAEALSPGPVSGLDASIRNGMLAGGLIGAFADGAGALPGAAAGAAIGAIGYGLYHLVHKDAPASTATASLPDLSIGGIGHR
jgi:hypothetical protein